MVSGEWGADSGCDRGCQARYSRPIKCGGPKVAIIYCTWCTLAERFAELADLKSNVSGTLAVTSDAAK
jgi:hypothetical protein